LSLELLIVNDHIWDHVGLQAKDYAHEAAMGAVCAAMAALKAVESDLAADYASSKDYARLKNHAEANGLALKVHMLQQIFSILFSLNRVRLDRAKLPSWHAVN
jgi:hypothetical protein